jgi:hypothetical protein
MAFSSASFFQVARTHMRALSTCSLFGCGAGVDSEVGAGVDSEGGAGRVE